MRRESDCCFLSVNKVVGNHINNNMMWWIKAFRKGISHSNAEPEHKWNFSHRTSFIIVWDLADGRP